MSDKFTEELNNQVKNDWFGKALNNSIESDAEALNELQTEYQQLKALKITDPDDKRTQEEGIAFYEERINFLKKRLRHNKKLKKHIGA